MPDSFDLDNRSRSADAVPAIPTSTSEVAVRTLASDIELMGQSGGMVNQSAPQAVQVSVTLHPEAVAGQPFATAAPASSGHGRTILIAVIVVLAALGLFALGYFVIGR